MKGLICFAWIFASVLMLKAEAAQSYTYVLDQFPTYASMSINVQDPAPTPFYFGTRIATVKMSASYLGMKVGDLTEISVINDQGQPLLDSRCRNPKDTGRSYNCYSSRFEESELWYKGFNGTRPLFMENMTAGDAGVKVFKFADIFTSLEQEYFLTPEFHNASSLFLILFRPDFGLDYNGRIFYVAGNEDFFKIRFKVTRLNANTLDIKFEPLTNRPDGGQVAATFPGRMAYDTNTKKVTRIYITVKNKEYVLLAK
ncbi:MAG: hypothetical protein A2X86_01380 [Bdellovibrionales bacterium GWA2_49_15]|nr:MAG: hypothetical protein A2X86_01380 [Bdellovibrionales bacterium GWA2_49_15]